MVHVLSRAHVSKLFSVNYLNLASQLYNQRNLREEPSLDDLSVFWEIDTEPLGWVTELPLYLPCDALSIHLPNTTNKNISQHRLRIKKPCNQVQDDCTVCQSSLL